MASFHYVRNLLFSTLTGLTLFACTVKEEEKTKTTGRELDPTIEAKIDDILLKMTLEEKVGQTCQITLDVLMIRDKEGKIIEPNVLDPDRVNKALIKYKIGSVLNVGYHTFTQEKWHEIISTLQNVATTETKNNIPLIYGIDAIHGVTYTVDGTLFPQEIGLAATWNPTCAENLGAVTAYETRASGISWNFSPVLDLGRQPLWSRFFETLGEDVYLAKTMGRAIVEGYQGNDPSNKFKVTACLKHFVGYSFPLSGRDRTPAWIPEVYMEELYLPPFKESIDAGALTVMVNSGEVNGIPGHSNYHLLTEVLKERWGFIGFTVSDWEDMIMLNTIAEIEPSYEKAIANAFNAGVDMSMVPYSPHYEKYCELLTKLVKGGQVDEHRLNDAVRRILRVKLMTGLFETTFHPKEVYPDFGSDKHQKLAYQAAAESITLLKNDSKILPLDKTTNIFICGPTANSLNCLNGAWTHTWQGIDTTYNTKGKLTILEALQNTFPNSSYSKGIHMEIVDGYEKNTPLKTQDVLNKAKQSDVIVACLGELPGTERPGDIRSLHIAQEQTLLINQLSELGKPIIVVLVEGHPRIIEQIETKSTAIIQAYLPGNEGGLAVADVISGKINPSGKLPYSYPRFDGVLEHYDHKKSEAKNQKSNNFKAYNPQWDFGHGLSYSQFEYTNIKTNAQNYKPTDHIIVSVNVTNKSNRAGKEVIQLYSKDKFASISPFGKRLRQFKKVLIKPEETINVKFKLSPDELAFVDRENNWTTESGEFLLTIGGLTSTVKILK